MARPSLSAGDSTKRWTFITLGPLSRRSSLGMAISLSFSHLASFRQPPFLSRKRVISARRRNDKMGRETVTQTLVASHHSFSLHTGLLLLSFPSKLFAYAFTRTGPCHSSDAKQSTSAGKLEPFRQKKKEGKQPKTRVRDEWLFIRRFASSEIYDRRLPHSAILKSITATLVCCVSVVRRVCSVSTPHTTLVTSFS